MIHSILIFNRQGKIRLQKWFSNRPDHVNREKFVRDLVEVVPNRAKAYSNIVELYAKDIKFWPTREIIEIQSIFWTISQAKLLFRYW